MWVYNRAIGEVSWNTLEEYVETPTAVGYGAGAESFSDYPMAAGHWLSNLLPPTAGQMLYLDAFGVRVGGEATAPKRAPEYMEQEPEIPMGYFPDELGADTPVIRPVGLPIIVALACLTVCAGAAASLWNAYEMCANTPPPDGCLGAPHWICMADCLAKNGCGGPVSIVLCLGCALCICVALRLPPKVCRFIADQLKKKTIKPTPRRSRTVTRIVMREKSEVAQYA